MRSGTELGQFLRVFLPTHDNRKNPVTVANNMQIMKI